MPIFKLENKPAIFAQKCLKYRQYSRIFELNIDFIFFLKISAFSCILDIVFKQIISPCKKIMMLIEVVNLFYQI